MTLIAQTDLPLRLLRRGKVRDVYEVDPETVLLVATDRVSAFDVVMQDLIPHKGAVLTQLTAWWLRQLEGTVAHHMLSGDTAEIMAQAPALVPHERDLRGRCMLAKRARVFPVECVMRGYIAGSAWKEYAACGTLAGQALPAGLREAERLPEPIFSPATKADQGHDENITFDRMAGILGPERAIELGRLTRAVYEYGERVAADRGIIIADTKLEFGVAAEAGAESGSAAAILVDEVLTPDSSRFWPADSYEPGRPQLSFDKQPLRDYLDRERRAGRWNGEPPPPLLPDNVIHAMSERYLDIYQRITLSPLDTGPAV